MARAGKKPASNPDPAASHADTRHYVNVFNIGHNAFEFVFEFGQQLSGSERVTVQTSIVTLPVYAQAFSRALDDSLERYAAEFGRIGLDQDASS